MMEEGENQGSWLYDPEGYMTFFDLGIDLLSRR